MGCPVQPAAMAFTLPLGIARQVGALGQVVTEQAIRVFIRATLPGTMGIGQVDTDRKALGQSFVVSHLFPTIVRQGFPKQCGDMPAAVSWRLRKRLSTEPSMSVSIYCPAERCAVNCRPTHCGGPARRPPVTGRAASITSARCSI